MMPVAVVCIIIIRYLSAGRTQTFYHIIASVQGEYKSHNIIVIRYFAIERNVRHVLMNGKRFFFYHHLSSSGRELVVFPAVFYNKYTFCRTKVPIRDDKRRHHVIRVLQTPLGLWGFN